MVESYRPEVGTVLEELAEGLAPFVDRKMRAHFGEQDWIITAATRMGKREPVLATATDPQFQLEVMVRWWGPVFSDTLSTEMRDVVHELRTARNEWAHIVEDRPIDADYAEAVARLAEELLRAVGSSVSHDVARLRGAIRLRATRTLAEEEGLDESEVLLKHLDDLQRQRDALREQLEDARAQAASATGQSRAVARQLAELQTQYAAVAELRDEYLELQQQLEVVRRAAGEEDPAALVDRLEEAQRAIGSLQEESNRLGEELDKARRALEDPVQTEAGRRWVMLVAALIMALGVVIILAVARGTAL